MEIKIKKAKISKGGCVEVTYTDEIGNEIALKGKNICHPDLKNAFAGLVPFLADLTEQREADRINWAKLNDENVKERLRSLEVTGFSVTDDDVNPIVTLVGNRTLRTSKTLNLTTGTGLNYDIEDYAHCKALEIAIKSCIREVEMYVKEKKWHVKQSEFDFNTTDEPFATVTPTEDIPLPDGNVA